MWGCAWVCICWFVMAGSGALGMEMETESVVDDGDDGGRGRLARLG